MKPKSKRSSTGHGTGALQATPLHRSKLRRSFRAAHVNPKWLRELLRRRAA